MAIPSERASAPRQRDTAVSVEPPGVDRAHRHSFRNIVQRHSQGQHGCFSKTAFDALGLRAAAVQMRNQPIQSQQE